MSPGLSLNHINKMTKFYVFVFLLVAIPCLGYAQNDTLHLNNGDVIVGDLKSMDRGVLTIEPSYSDADFKITWEDITEMMAYQRYLITLSDGRRISGTFRSAGPKSVLIDNEEGEDVTVDQNDIVNIMGLEGGGFLSRLSANIDFGLSLTKANNQRQLNGNLRVGYLEDRWSADLYYNRGCAHLAAGRLNEALSDFTKSISMNEVWSLAYNNRGTTYARLQQYDKAIADFSKAIELEPGNGLAYRNRALAYKKAGELQKAKADLQYVIKLEKKDAPATVE